MTGEPLGVVRTAGHSVFAGTVVEEGSVVVRVTKLGDETRLKQIVSFIEESETLKAGIQGRFERMADMAVPFTFALAGLVFLLTRDPIRASSVLLVDYSCALKLTTPLTVLAAMREGAMNNVVIKGGRYLEALRDVDTVVFDKTGTLTNATPHVACVVAAPGFEEDLVLRDMACLEEHFPHPVARAVCRAAESRSLGHPEEHDKVQYIVAHGVCSMLRGEKVVVGSRHYVECDEGIDVSPLHEAIERETAQGRSLLFVAEGGKIAGLVSIEDPPRPEAVSVIAGLKKLGVDRILMITGDDERTAKAIAARLGITEYRAEVLPTDKSDVVQQTPCAHGGRRHQRCPCPVRCQCGRSHDRRHGPGAGCCQRAAHRELPGRPVDSQDAGHQGHAAHHQQLSLYHGVQQPLPGRRHLYDTVARPVGSFAQHDHRNFVCTRHEAQSA